MMDAFPETALRPSPEVRPAVRTSGEPALSVAGLVVEVDGKRAVDTISFAIERGRTFCLVGESGCGKSLTCQALLGQLPPNARIASGTIDIHEHRARPRTGARRPKSP